MQQSINLAKGNDARKIHATYMDTGEREISKHSAHPDPYLTKSEVRVSMLKVIPSLDYKGCRSIFTRESRRI